MQAAIYRNYGPPEVVRIEETAKPTVAKNQLMVKVHATTVNRNDCGFRTPEYPFVTRPIHGLFKPRRQILGTEFAGVVEQLGSEVKAFAVGNEVFGLTGNDFGTHAEYVCVPANGAVALKPTNMTFEQAAAICDGPWLAMNMLRTFDTKVMTKVLVNGASGSIGSSCVQLLKYFGAEVTAVCSPRSIDIVRKLGADQIIDYEKEDFTKLDKVFDVILDAVGKSSFPRCKHLLQPNGLYLSSELGDWFFQNPSLAILTPLCGGRQVRFPIPRLRQSDFILFKQMAEAGNLSAVIDRTYPLSEIIDAYRYVETGQKIGSVVIKVTK